MNRDLGIVELLQGAVPDAATSALAATTRLGDTWFVLLLVFLVYWFRDRRDGAFAIGVLLGGLAVVVGAKAAFGFPRPPEAIRLVVADGYGFPSGHAVAATVAWGTLAVTLDVWTRARRLAVAGAVVALVAFTRVALGVHFAVDVFAGVVVGVVYLAAVVRWGAGAPTRSLGVAVLLSAIAVVLTAGGGGALLLFGVSAGALAAYRTVDVPTGPWNRGDALHGIATAALVAGVLLAGYLAVDLTLLAAALGFLGGVAVIAAPAVVVDGRFARMRVTG